MNQFEENEFSSNRSINRIEMEYNYRFYHCYQKPFSIVCHTVDNQSILPSEPNSRLLFVPKYVPEVLDKIVLTYNYYRSIKIIKH
jgi:hypothetical protein